MSTWRVWKRFLVVLAAGQIGVALAALCPKCQEMMFTCDIGRCGTCGGDTASGGYQLCGACGDKAGQCQACRASLKPDRPAGQESTGKAPLPEAKPTEHKLPDDPKAVVIQYRTAAHVMGRMLPESGPDLVILADGTVIAHDPFGRPPLPPERVVVELPSPEGGAPKPQAPEPEKPAHVASVQGTIKPEELQDLLRFVLDESRFFEFDPRAAMDKHNASRAPQIADAASTAFEVTADGRTHKAWVYAVDVSDYDRSPVPELVRMHAVYNRLAALRQKTIAEAGRNTEGVSSRGDD